MWYVHMYAEWLCTHWHTSETVGKGGDMASLLFSYICVILFYSCASFSSLELRSLWMHVQRYIYRIHVPLAVYSTVHTLQSMVYVYICTSLSPQCVSLQPPARTTSFAYPVRMGRLMRRAMELLTPPNGRSVSSIPIPQAPHPQSSGRLLLWLP